MSIERTMRSILKRQAKAVLVLAPVVFGLALSALSQSAQTPKEPAPGSLVVFDALGGGKSFEEGVATYFRVRIPGANSKEQTRRLSSRLAISEPRSFWLQPGLYEIVTHRQACRRLCREIKRKKESECRAFFSMKSGEALYAVRNNNPDGSCSVSFSTSPPTEILFGRVVAEESSPLALWCANFYIRTSVLVSVQGDNAKSSRVIRVRFSFPCEEKKPKVFTDSSPQWFHLIRSEKDDLLLEEFRPAIDSVTRETIPDLRFPNWRRLRGAENEQIPFGNVVPGYRSFDWPTVPLL